MAGGSAASLERLAHICRQRQERRGWGKVCLKGKSGRGTQGSTLWQGLIEARYDSRRFVSLQPHCANEYCVAKPLQAFTKNVETAARTSPLQRSAGLHAGSHHRVAEIGLSWPFSDTAT